MADTPPEPRASDQPQVPLSSELETTTGAGLGEASRSDVSRIVSQEQGQSAYAPGMKIDCSDGFCRMVPDSEDESPTRPSLFGDSNSYFPGADGLLRQLDLAQTTDGGEPRPRTPGLQNNPIGFMEQLLRRQQAGQTDDMRRFAPQTQIPDGQRPDPRRIVDRLRQRQPGGQAPLLDTLQTILSSPEAQQIIGGIAEQAGVHMDAERKEIKLDTDFAALYDRFGPKDVPDEQRQETRRLLSNLDWVTISPDQIRMKFDSEQRISLGDTGFASNFELSVGAAENKEVTINLQTTDTTMKLTNIEGMFAVNKDSGKRSKVYQLSLDASNADNPRGTIRVDNPLYPEEGDNSLTARAARKLMPAIIDAPMLLPEDQKAEMRTVLPPGIKTLDGIREAANQGDLTVLKDEVSLDDLVQLMSWMSSNRSSMDLNNKNPLQYRVNETGQSPFRPNTPFTPPVAEDPGSSVAPWNRKRPDPRLNPKRVRY